MRLICFGDSNTYGFDPRGYFGGRYAADSRWVDIIARELGLACLNLGENGRMIPRSGGPGLAPGDFLLVMLGTNDLLCGAPAAECAARLRRFLAGCSIADSRAMVIAPPALRRGAWVRDERQLSESRLLAPLYESAARELGLHFADAGRWGVELAYDGVHFTENGSRSFAAGLKKALIPIIYV